MAHACNPWEAEVGGSFEVRSSRPGYPTWWNPISTKNTKISPAWWWVPVIPATGEAEAGELPEPRRWRLQWAKITPLHTSLGNRSETPSQKRKTRLTWWQVVVSQLELFRRNIRVSSWCLGKDLPKCNTRDFLFKAEEWDRCLDHILVWPNMTFPLLLHNTHVLFCLCSI